MERYDCTEDFVTELFCRVDGAMAGVGKDPRASLWPGEVVTLAILFALKGSGERAFYRWASRDLRPMFPRLPQRTRLFRLFAAHGREWADRFLADATFFGVADSFGIRAAADPPPRSLASVARLGRSPRGRSRGAGSAGAGGSPASSSAGSSTPAGRGARVGRRHRQPLRRRRAFAHLVDAFGDRMIVLADCNFHKSPFHRKGDDRDPPNLKVCPRNVWNERRLIETLLSMLQAVCSLKRLRERSWPYLKAHLAFAAAAFNVLLNWDGEPKLAIARFSL